MLARVINNTDIVLANLTVPEEEAVIERFTLEVSNRFVDASGGGFNGIYKKYDKTRQRLARPFLGELKLMCQEQNLPLVVKDERPPWKYHVTNPSEIGHDFLAGITLETYQVEAIQKACVVEVGVFDILPSGGKCVCAESEIFIEGIGPILIGTLCAGLVEEEIKSTNGLKVKGPNGLVDVVALYKTNKRKILRLELESGVVLRGVPEHRVFTKRGWVMLKDLRPDDEVAIDD